MSHQRVLRSPLGVVSVLGAASLVLRAVTSLVDNPDFGVPGDGWRSVMQFAVAGALVAGVVRSVGAARRAMTSVAILYAVMTVWERFDEAKVLAFITVTERDIWAHPAIAVLAAVTAAFGARGHRDRRTVSVSRTISASPSALFAIVTDLSTMGRLSPETTRCEWTGSQRGVGATFEGFNADASRTWSTTCVVTEFEQDRRFAFEVRRPAKIARWTYEFSGSDDTCDVRETWEDLRNPLVRAISARRSGISDRAAHNATTMATTLSNLDAIATTAERRRQSR